jgi:elongation factor Tu
MCMCVFIQVPEEELLEMVEEEVRELLQTYGFDENAPIIRGSALEALEGNDTDLGKKSIVKLMEKVDSYFQDPVRPLDKPFFMPIQEVFSIAGRYVDVLVCWGCLFSFSLLR